MALNAEVGGGSFILKSRNDVKKLEELVSDFLYYGEGETNDCWDRIPFEYTEKDEEIFFSYQFASSAGYLSGVSLSEVENKIGIKIDINNVESSLEEQGVDWDDFSEVCREVWDENPIEITEEKLLKFKKELSETEEIIDDLLFEHSTQTIENSHIYEEEEKHFNSFDENGRKTLNLVSHKSKEHYWEENASEFIGFDSIEDHYAKLKEHIRSIGNSLQKTDFIRLTEVYFLRDKRGETLEVQFKFDLTFEVKSNTFFLELSPCKEDLSPIYEYFSNLQDA